MLGKPTKEELSKMLQAQCEQALFLDNTIHTLYASEPEPTKGRYRQKKKAPDAYAEEVAQLQADREGKMNAPQSSVTTAQDAGGDVDVESFEKEVAAFMRGRRRK